MSTKPRTKRGPAGEVARPRCAILARVSTAEQHLDAQVPMLQAEAERRGFDVVALIEDVGSGRKMDEREGLRRVLELADARAIDVLLVAELSRVGRSVASLSAPSRAWSLSAAASGRPQFPLRPFSSTLRATVSRRRHVRRAPHPMRNRDAD